jgi:hypothetical protein
MGEPRGAEGEENCSRDPPHLLFVAENVCWMMTIRPTNNNLAIEEGGETKE